MSYVQYLSLCRGEMYGTEQVQTQCEVLDLKKINSLKKILDKTKKH